MERNTRAMFDPKSDPITEEEVNNYMQRIEGLVTELDEHNKELFKKKGR